MVQVRRYTADDCDDTIAIFVAAIREVASRDYSPAEIEAWAQVEDRAAWAERRASRPTFIVERGGHPVGFSDLEPDGHLDMMFVHPAHHGIGVASLLLAKVEEEARKKGIDRIFTEASLTARPFFERRGFTVIARQSVEKRGQHLTNFRMEKYLAETAFS
ncbi:GNAT family N-acetyltransferase [Rhizobium sp. AN80A]|uniref:GNAT family N-acetyltransferase n=1 Tax=Rhizobium sp. AN80A TaxID=3040673 RepID=UPI0024B3B7B0|nr:GNAT family N-acetyltransferase [Rhizobium sp. AN80A]